MPKSKAFARIRAEVLRLVALIPEGKFTTYGSLATHMNVVPLHVAAVLGGLTPEEAAANFPHTSVNCRAEGSSSLNSAHGRAWS